MAPKNIRNKDIQALKVPSGVQLIMAERERQVSVKGWTPRHDDEHDGGEMALAAECYLKVASGSDGAAARMGWPWDYEWWKPSDDPVRNLTKAGALIAAEIDRLLRERQREGGEVMAEEKPVDVRLAEIRARLADASPGPWRLHHRMVGAEPDDDERIGLGWDWDDNAGPPEPMRGVFARATDAKFVANIHEDMAYLLVQLAAKDEEIKAAFRPYLKDGETPIERLERERADNDMLLGLLAAEKAKVREAFAAGRQSRCAFRQGERRWFFGSSEATTKTAEGFTAWLAQRHQEQEKP